MIRTLRRHAYLVSILTVAFGLVLMFWPKSSLIIMCQIVGWGLVITGAAMLIQCLIDKVEGYRIVPVGGSVILLLLGFLVLRDPVGVSSIIPTIIGIIVLANGLYNLVQTLQLRRERQKNWLLALVLAAATVIFGIVILARPFSAAGLLVAVIGCILVYNGLSNIWTLRAISRIR